MPTFEIRLEDGRKIDIDAPNAQMAAKGGAAWAKANPPRGRLPIFTVQTPEGRKLRIEAPDEATALRGAREWSAQQGGRQSQAPVRAQSADGKIHEFPAGTSPAVIDRVMKDYARQQRGGIVENVQGAMANFNRGMAVGDEIYAGAQTALGFATGRHRLYQDGGLGKNLGVVRDAFKNELAGQRQAENVFATERPRTAALARGTGMAATVAAPLGGQANLFAQGTRAANMARGATLAAGQGAVYAAADAGTPQERLAAASRAARDPLTVMMGAGAGRLASRGPPRPAKAPPVDVGALRTQRDAAYRAVDDSGFRYGKADVAQMVDDMKADLAAKRFDPDFHPQAARMVQKLEQRVASGNEPTLSELDDLRKFIGENVAGLADKTQRRLGRAMVNRVDTFIEGVGGEGSDLVTRARKLHGQVRKVETVQDAFGRAERAAAKPGGANIDSAIRSQMDRVLQNTPNLTAAERAALEEIVMGSRGQNTLRQLGKFSPQGSGLSQWFNLGTVAMTGPLGLSVPALGMASKAASNRIARQKVQNVIRLIAEGSPQGLRQAQQELSGASGPAADALRRAVAARLSRAAGVAGGERVARQPNPFAEP